MIIEQLEVTWMSVFCYLLCEEETREAALIDPAGDFDDIFTAVSRHDARVRYIINTHGHWDHTSGNARAVKKTGAMLLVHEADAEHARSIPNRILSLTLGGRVSPEPVRLLRGGESIPLGSRELHIMHTPGHTPGHTCLLLANGTAFAADLIGSPRRPHAQNLLATDWRQIPSSLAHLQAAHPEVVYMGHSRRPITGQALQGIQP